MNYSVNYTLFELQSCLNHPFEFGVLFQVNGKKVYLTLNDLECAADFRD